MTRSEKNEDSDSFLGDKEFEQLQSDLKNVGSSMHGLFSSLYDISSKRIDKYVTEKKNHFDEFNLQRKERYECNSQNSFEYPPVYETRQALEHGRGHGNSFFTTFDWDLLADMDNHFFSGWHRSPFGHTTRRKPSIRAYNDCLDKNGESVYDTKGRWRCLFPNSEIPVEYLNFKEKHFPEVILTKEDFNLAVEGSSSVDVGKDGVYDLGKQGIFFKKFDDMMNWKCKMRENIRYQSRLDGATKDATIPEKSETKPLGESVQYSYNSRLDLNTNQAELVEIKTEYFSDGTSTVRTVTKSKPSGSRDWVDVSENVVENRPENQLESSRNGWLWNKRN